MTSETTATINEIIRKRKITAGVPQQIAENLKSLELNVVQLKDLQQVFQALPELSSSATQKLNQLNLQELSDRIAKERETWEILWQRLNRETINIGVIGLARQGKSTFLQKVAGLTNDEIPSSDRMPCTSVQSNIYHIEERTQAKVHFHSEESFLKQVIEPYFDELGFSPSPKSLTEFRNLSLSQPINPRHPARAEAVYNHLKDDYHAHIGIYGGELKAEKRFIEVPKEKIKEYVSQDYDEKGNPQFFNHLAVEKVEIHCPFPEMKVKKIGLVDMPGLGDTRLGDAKRMIKALGQDIDYILFIRRPDKKGDHWGNRDVDLYDEASQALKDKLPLQEWSFLLLNQDGENERQCNDLENTRINKGIHVKKCLRGNCIDQVSANEILKEVLNELAENMDRLDQQYMSAAFKGLADFQDFSYQGLQEIRQVVEDLGNIDAAYFKLKDVFLEQLYKEIEDFREKSRQAFKQPNGEFKSQVDTAINRCKQEVNIPDSNSIVISAKNRGIDGAYFDAIQEMRADLLQQFHSVEAGLKQSLHNTKSSLAEIFIQMGLGRAVDQEDSEFLEALAESLAKNNELKNLAMGFNFIVSFEIMYKGFIQSQVWEKLSEVLPPDPMTPVKTPDPVTTVLTALQQRRGKAIEECQKVLNTLGESVNRVQISMIEEFSDHITRARGVKREWDIFLNKNRGQIWVQLQGLEEQKELQKQWLKAVDDAISNAQRLSS